MNNIFRIFALSLILGLVPALAGGGEYELSYGKQFNLCHAYAENLNTFTDMDHPMICEQPINPELKDFKTPEWVELDIKKNIPLLEQVLVKGVFSKHTPEETRKKLIEMHTNWALEGKEFFYTTHIDINNDGQKDHVLRWDRLPGARGCDPTHKLSFRKGRGQNLFILDGTMNILSGASKSLRFNRYTVFLYQGRTFLSDWQGNVETNKISYKPGSGGGGLWVHEPKRSRRKDGYFPVIRVCTFEYTEAKAGETP